MQKNLALKTAAIIVVLLVFLYGIFGIPKGLSGDALKASLLERINLGLDLKGGTHLILQVAVNDAVGAESDRAVEQIKESLDKAKVAYAEISKPDPANQPDRIVVKGLSTDGSSELRRIVGELLPQYDLASATDTNYTLAMKVGMLNDLKNRAVAQSIEAIRTRVDSLGVSEPVIQEHGLGDYQILVQLPGVDDPTRVKDIIQSTARLEMHQVFDGAGGYENEQAALQAHGGVLPPNTILLHGRAGTGGESQDRVYIVGRNAVVGGTDIRHAEPGQDQDGS